MRYSFPTQEMKEEYHMIVRMVMAFMGAVGCMAFCCAVAGVDTAVLSIGEAFGTIFGFSGVFFAVLMLKGGHHGNKFHKM
jgi:hypothetical protein